MPKPVEMNETDAAQLVMESLERTHALDRHTVTFRSALGVIEFDRQPVLNSDSCQFQIRARADGFHHLIDLQTTKGTLTNFASQLTALLRRERRVTEMRSLEAPLWVIAVARDAANLYMCVHAARSDSKLCMSLYDWPISITEIEALRQWTRTFLRTGK